LLIPQNFPHPAHLVPQSQLNAIKALFLYCLVLCCGSGFGSEFIWLSRIRIHTENADPDPDSGASKMTKIIK
jgi:hypothetical protein